MPNLIEMTSDTDINYIKQKFTEIYCKIMLPESMVDFEKETVEEQKQEAGVKQKMVTIEITIKMPRAEIVLEDEMNKPTYIMNLNSDDMILLVKDKFTNWKELIKDIFGKLHQQKYYTPSADKENVFYTHRDENVQNIDWGTHSC